MPQKLKFRHLDVAKRKGGLLHADDTSLLEVVKVLKFNPINPLVPGVQKNKGEGAG